MPRLLGPITAIVTWLAVIGCGPAPVAFQPPGQFCAAAGMSDQRCEAVLARAFEESGIGRHRVAAVEYGFPNGKRVELGGVLAAVVRFHLEDGTMRDQEVWCIGITGSVKPWCTDDPRPDPFT